MRIFQLELFNNEIIVLTVKLEISSKMDKYTGVPNSMSAKANMLTRE